MVVLMVGRMASPTAEWKAVAMVLRKVLLRVALLADLLEIGSE
jgi:hypothetical protein